MSPALLAKPRPAAIVRPAPAGLDARGRGPVHRLGRVTGQPSEVTCPACVAWQVEQAWTIRHTRMEAA